MTPHAALPKNHLHGFTLIELIVVILLVGIIASMGMANLTDWVTAREAKQEVQVLRDKIRVLMDDAVISQMTLALKIYPDYIKIYEHKDGGWQDSLRNGEQGKIGFGQGIRLGLVSPDGALLDLTTSGKGEMEMVYLGSDGQTSLYRLRVEDADTYCDIGADMAGNLELFDCVKKLGTL